MKFPTIVLVKFLQEKNSLLILLALLLSVIGELLVLLIMLPLLVVSILGGEVPSLVGGLARSTGIEEWNTHALLVIFVVTYAASLGLRVFGGWISLQIAAKFESSLTSYLLARVLGSKLELLDPLSKDDLLKNLISDVQDICQRIVSPSIIVLSSCFSILVLSLGLFLVSPLNFMVFGFLCFAAGLIIIITTRSALASAGKRRSDSAKKKFDSISFVVSQFRLVKTLNKEHVALEAVYRASMQFSRAMASGIFFSSLPRFIVEGLLVTGLFLFLIVGYGDLSAKVPLISIFGAGALKLLPFVSSLVSGLQSIRIGNAIFKASYFRSLIFDFFCEKQLGDKERSDVAWTKMIGKNRSRPIRKTNSRKIGFSVNGLEYSYKHRNSVFDGLQLEVRPGEKVCLVGQNGSGKSTLFDLITGLRVPRKGNLSFYTEDGPIEHDQVIFAYVPPVTSLVDGGILENILLDKTFSTDRLDNLDLAWSAVEAKDSLRLSSLLNNEVIHEGTDVVHGLSTGELQRIGILRALVQPFDILLLDEAVAGIEEKNRINILQNILGFAADKTVICISHSEVEQSLFDRNITLGRA